VSTYVGPVRPVHPAVLKEFETMLRSHNVPRRSVALVTTPSEEGRTQQQFKEEADINVLVKRFGITGTMPQDVRVPLVGDFEGVSDFQSALNSVVQARDDFMALPAQVRKRFANDPQLLMEFMADEKNKDEAQKLGLLNTPVEVPRDAVKAIDELAAKLVTPPASK